MVFECLCARMNVRVLDIEEVERERKSYVFYVTFIRLFIKIALHQRLSIWMKTTEQWLLCSCSAFAITYHAHTHTHVCKCMFVCERAFPISYVELLYQFIISQRFISISCAWIKWQNHHCSISHICWQGLCCRLAWVDPVCICFVLYRQTFCLYTFGA